jgi:hypothetical protein
MAEGKFKEPSSLPTKDSCDKAFVGSGQQPGLEIWRIEKFQVVKAKANGKDTRDESLKGKLYSGDSYILLHTKKKNSTLERDIFFWLGKDSSQDERGACAYKTVELDTYHDDEPTQHREVQGHETPEFLDLFKHMGGLQYCDGGVESGFRKVDREAYETRLFHVKGRRHVLTTQVKVEAASLNVGDVFILDTKHDIYQWNGKECSRLEKQHAMEVTRKIRDDDHNKECRAKIHIIEDGVDDDAAFWEAMGCAKPGAIAAATDDDAHEKQQAANIKLYHLSDVGGSLQVTEIEERPLKKEMLKEEDACILSTGHAIYAWIGKGASQGEKLHSMKYATQFISTHDLPDWTPVSRITQGAETQQFKQYFPGWKDPVVLPGTIPAGMTKSKFKKQTFDHKAMFEQKKRELERLPDDGSGKLTVWRVEKREKVEVKSASIGHFYSGDSYVILYEYKDKRDKDAAFIYFWQGHNSSQDEKADSAIMAMHLDDEMGGYPVQVRVVQGKEPPHFFKIFEKYGIVIHEGGIGSGFKNRDEADSYDTDGTRLFHIRGTNDFNTRAVQVKEAASSLSSGDTFILETPEVIYLWLGKGCSGDERDFMHKIRKSSGMNFQSKDPDPVLVTEGEEPAAFWKVFGSTPEEGPNLYAKVEIEEVPEAEPRLFQCSDARGYFWAEEIFDFDQEDLVEDDVMLLDTWREIFIWIGQGAKDSERKEAMELAKKYVSDAAEVTKRGVDDVTFLVIRQGMEPVNFTCHFLGWSDDKWRNGKSYEEMKAELEAQNPAEAAAIAAPVSLESELAKVTVGGVKYPYDVLVNGQQVDGEYTNPPTWPDGLDLTQKEKYLADDEFEKLFEMSPEEFTKLPKWKQLNKKKTLKLF